MNDLMDNFARILATPMPRRKAFKLFGGALAAAVFAISGAKPASAATCGKGQVTCGNNGACCKNTSCCYGSGGKSCCSGFLQGGNCLSKKPSSGNYTSC
jgi:hypothetical protein